MGGTSENKHIEQDATPYTSRPTSSDRSSVIHNFLFGIGSQHEQCLTRVLAGRRAAACWTAGALPCLRDIVSWDVQGGLSIGNQYEDHGLS